MEKPEPNGRWEREIQFALSFFQPSRAAFASCYVRVMEVVFLTFLKISRSISGDPSIMLAKKRAPKMGRKKAILELKETYLPPRLSEGAQDRAYPWTKWMVFILLRSETEANFFFHSTFPRSVGTSGKCAMFG